MLFSIPTNSPGHERKVPSTSQKLTSIFTDCNLRGTFCSIRRHKIIHQKVPPICRFEIADGHGSIGAPSTGDAWLGSDQPHSCIPFCQAMRGCGLTNLSHASLAEGNP
jgi:hypothetical protein